MKYALQALELGVHLGITKDEQAEPQMVLCDVSFEAESDKGAKSDNLEDVLSYQEVYDVIKNCAHAEGASWNLLEKLHADIEASIKAGFPQIERLEVSLTKFPFEDGAIMVTK